MKNYYARFTSLRLGHLGGTEPATHWRLFSLDDPKDLASHVNCIVDQLGVGGFTDVDLVEIKEV